MQEDVFLIHGIFHTFHLSHISDMRLVWEPDLYVKRRCAFNIRRILKGIS